MVSQASKRIIKKAVMLSGIMFLFLSVVCVSRAEKTEAERLAEVELKRKMAETAKNNLMGTTWAIELTQMTDSSKKETLSDTINFKDGKIESEHLTAEEFTPTNFTVSIKGTDRVVWETMQSSENKGLAFWRGEVRKGRMRGVLSRHYTKSKIKDYTFRSTGDPIPIALTEEEAAKQAAEAAAPAQPVAQEQAKQDVKKATEPKAAQAAEETQAPTQQRRRWWWNR